MPRLVHLARASLARSIARAGVRGARWELLVGSERQVTDRAVFAMPVLPDFAVSHQWLRELRRWHDERMVAVHLLLGSDEPVLVGRYGQRHERVPLGEAIARVRAAPAGAEIVVPRSIRKAEVAAVRELTQLVGWAEVPSGEKRLECVCPACLGKGTRTFMRRVRASYQQSLARARAATTPDEIARALSFLSTPLERAEGRIPPTKLRGYARSPHPEVRRTVAELVGHFRPVDVRELLAALVSDEDEGIQRAAATSALRLLGPRRSLTTLREAPVAARAQFAIDLAWHHDERAAVAVLEALAEDPDVEVRDAAEESLRVLREE